MTKNSLKKSASFCDSFSEWNEEKFIEEFHLDSRSSLARWRSIEFFGLSSPSLQRWKASEIERNSFLWAGKIMNNKTFRTIWKFDGKNEQKKEIFFVAPTLQTRVSSNNFPFFLQPQLFIFSISLQWPTIRRLELRRVCVQWESSQINRVSLFTWLTLCNRFAR